MHYKELLLDFLNLSNYLFYFKSQGIPSNSDHVSISVHMFRTETKNAKEMELALLTAQREKLEKAKDMKEQLAITR